MGFCCSSTGFYLLVPVGVYLLHKYVKALLLRRKLERWNNTPKDVVIFHNYPKATTLPSGSPYALKLQTYLRMANIKYETDDKDWWGPKGKCPWISFNGQHIGDSELIIQFLNKKFEKNLDARHSEESLALAASLKIMLEEHAFWGMALDRFVFTRNLHKMTTAWSNPVVALYVRFVLSRKTMTAACHQGIGRHTEEEVVNLVSNDLRIVSKLLGTKKFIAGDEPCVDDCAIFGVLAQCVWGLSGSPYEKLVHDELTNLKGYCHRMKERFFPDWEQCLQK